MLGGSAVHFSLAASFFTDVRLVGVVGEDFGSSERAVLEGRGIDTSDVEVVPGGKTFFWRGRYDRKRADRPWARSAFCCAITGPAPARRRNC